MTTTSIPEHWLPRFKELAGCADERAYLDVQRKSRWQIEVNLMLSEFTIVGSWKVNVRTGVFERTL